MKEIKKILVPVDYSDNSKKILESASFFAAKCEAAVHVLYVVQSFEDYSGFFVPHTPIAKFEEEMVSGAEAKMESILAEYPTAAAKVLCGDVAEEIVSYADRESFDLIIMGTHGYKGLERVMFGSVADKVVKSAPCPVMTINPYKE
jgi:nucleotide-binding universal stress UspA family protein